VTIIYALELKIKQYPRVKQPDTAQTK